MLCAKLDSQLIDLARRSQSAYTRYADDITFSSSRRSFPKPIAYLDSVTNQIVVGVELSKVVAHNGFQINQSKVRLQKTGQRQQVTGLTVNEKPNVDPVVDGMLPCGVRSKSTLRLESEAI